MRTTLTAFKASTYVRLTGYKPELVKQVLMPFCKRNFCRVQKLPGDRPGTFKWEVSHVFARFNESKTELRFSLEKLPDLLKMMQDNGYSMSRIDVKDEKIIPAKKIELKLLNPDIKPRNEMQEEYCEFMRGFKSLVVNNMGTGQGKAQPLSGKVKVPGGQTTMGEIKVGDFVTAWDGSAAKVVSIHPQGVKDIYRFKFSDGREAESTLDHLWKVHSAGKEQVITTEEIIRKLEKKHAAMYVPFLQPEVTDVADLPVDPYFLGALIADSSYTTLGVQFIKPDAFLTDKLSTMTPVGVYMKHFSYHQVGRWCFVTKPNPCRLSHEVTMLKLFGNKTEKKSIPSIYMNGSQEQKWELIRGMMDTVGSPGTDGRPVFNTSSEILAKQFQELIWSLGGWCKITIKSTGENKDIQYKCTVRIASPKQCFSLPRKKDRVPDDAPDKEEFRLQISSVELVRKEEAQCISIDHPDHLYVCDDYVVTHNTFCALYSSYHISERILITVLPRYIDIWIKAFGEFYELKPEDVLLGADASVSEVHQAIVSGRVNPKIIIIPLTKIDIHIKKMKEEPETTTCLDKIFEDLQCGVRIIDEAHESIFSVYQSLMYGNHKKTMALSATLQGDDDFINGIYNQIFPHKSYLRPPVYSRYMHIVAWWHRMDMWKHKINTKGFGGYSHVKFEQGILKRPALFESYYQMLKEAFVQYYVDTLKEGQKFMWFFATIEFCEEFHKRLAKDYPEMDIITFTSVMSKKKGQETAYREHQGVITTPGSCGTGKDIPMLYAVFSPIAVSSSQRNTQMAGRIRPIDKWWSDLDPIFVYFVCQDDKKQVEYGKKRRELFDKTTKKFTIIDSGRRL